MTDKKHKNIWLHRIIDPENENKGKIEVRVEGGSEPILALSYDETTLSNFDYNYTHALKFAEGVRAGISIQCAHGEYGFTVHTGLFEDEDTSNS